MILKGCLFIYLLTYFISFNLACYYMFNSYLIVCFFFQQLKDKYFLNSNDKISYFYEKDAIGADGKLQVDSSISLNKVKAH